MVFTCDSLGFFLLWTSTATILYSRGVKAQDFSVPSGWTNHTSSAGPGQRAQLASDAIGLLTPRIDSTKGVIPDISSPSEAAAFLSILALNDWISGNTTYQTTVQSSIQTYESRNPNFVTQPDALNSDTIIWGITAYYAYRAYRDQVFLQLATEAWAHASQYTITEAQAANGSHPLRNVTFPSTCSGFTVAGGIFWKADALSDTGVNGETIGPFLALSAYLFEAAPDPKYNTSAELSAAFIRNHLYDGITIGDTFNVQGCGSNNVVVTYNSGFAIEGFAVWGNVSRNVEWSNLTSNLVATTVPFPTWTASDGIIIEAARDAKKNLEPDDITNGFKGFFMRGLHEAWWRSDPNSGMAKLIESFITVQFNALIHLASTSAPENVYSPSWNGPAITNFSAYSEVTALQVLNPALGLSLAGNNSTNGTATGPGAAPSATSSAGGANPSSPHTGAIVGGVIGSLFGLLFVFGLVLLLIRHRHRKRPVLPGEASRRQPSALTIEPFMSEAYTRPPHILPISLVLPNGTITTKFQREVARPWRGRQSEAGFSATGQANSSVSHPADSGSTPPTSRGSTSPTSAGNSSGGRLRTRGRAVTSGVPSLVRELVDGIFAQIDARARDSQERSEGVPPPTYVQ